MVPIERWNERSRAEAALVGCTPSLSAHIASETGSPATGETGDASPAVFPLPPRHAGLRRFGRGVAQTSGAATRTVTHCAGLAFRTALVTISASNAVVSAPPA